MGKAPEASRFLVAVGTLAALPTALSGLSDWLDTDGAEKRVGLVHAVGNLAGTCLFLASWRARRHSRSGQVLALAGLIVASGAGWLGGHLSYALGVGVDTNAFETGPEDWTVLGSQDASDGLHRCEVNGVGIVLVGTSDGVFRVGRPLQSPGRAPFGGPNRGRLHCLSVARQPVLSREWGRPERPGVRRPADLRGSLRRQCCRDSTQRSTSSASECGVMGLSDTFATPGSTPASQRAHGRAGDPTLSAPEVGVDGLLHMFIEAGPTSTPRPGSGHTWERFRTLASIASGNLSAARLIEGHLDALAILAEAGIAPQPSATYGVWAARSGKDGLRAQPVAGGWRLTGSTPFCSGVRMLDRALVTAEAEDGYRLFDIDVSEQVTALVPGSWLAVGMAESASETVVIGGPTVPDAGAVGGPGFYTNRPGFWFGAVGVAACWYGGALGLVQALAGRMSASDPYALAEIGRAKARIQAMFDVLHAEAGRIDADPADERHRAQLGALAVRGIGPSPVHRGAGGSGGCRRGTSALSRCGAGAAERRPVRLFIPAPWFPGRRRARSLRGGRAEMELTVDDSHPGTPESAWRRSRQFRSMLPLQIGDPRRLIVIAPHPDDETLGAAGLMTVAAERSIPIEIIAVTEGEVSHPANGIDISELRAQERHNALERLGVRPTIHRLGIPDGSVTANAEEVFERFGRILRGGDLCVAPWPRDGHPDHDACGAAACRSGREVGCSLLQYLVWAWHWATPDSDEIAWAAGRRLTLSWSTRIRKRWSIRAFQSQTTLSRVPGRIEPVLPPAVLARFHRPFEIFLEGEPT